MNARIRKIAIEADAWCDRYYFGDKFYDIEWEKKFAELIIQQCANIATYPQLGDEESYYGNEFAKAIKKHFGVK